LQRIEEREAVIFGDFKLIRWTVSGRQELYDLARDPGETTDLSASSEKTAEGGRLLDRFEAEGEQRRRTLGITRPDRIPPNPETLKRLRALGYVQ
jgi:hypothetical protein